MSRDIKITEDGNRVCKKIKCPKLSVYPNVCRGVPCMFRKLLFLKSGRYRFISNLFIGICHHPGKSFAYFCQASNLAPGERQ